MASSSSSATHFSERANDFTSQTASEMESSRIRHWTNLDYSRTSSEWSAVTNFKDFDMLKEHPVWGHFFRDFHTLELGEKISEGAQADIFEARLKSDGPFNLVAKVMKGDAPLQAFQAQWPVGMLSASNSKVSIHSKSFVFDLPLISIIGGTVLTERRLWGRFAFVMYRRWGDLRLLIDRRMKHKRASLGPFSMDEVIRLMLRIAEDMEGLHDKYDIIHRDLKASNVLVWGEFGDDVNVVAPNQGETFEGVVADIECSLGIIGTGWWTSSEILQQLKERVPRSKGETIECVVADFECSLGVMGTGWWTSSEILQQLKERVPRSKGETIECVVADFECSLGVMGTGWWRAPEILQQLRERVPSSKVQFTRKSDIYSYGMTCYEIVSGCLPFEGKSASEASCKIVSDRTLCEDQSVSEGSCMSVCEDRSVSEGSYLSVLSCLPSSVSSASEESGASYEIVSIDEVLNGRRPYLPVELPSFLKTIIVSCWQSDPEDRPSFSDICKMLKNGDNPTDVVIDNTSNKFATIIKVKEWNNSQYRPLPQALERLLQMQLLVTRATILPFRDGARDRVVQYFEVQDGEGRKVCDENCIADIVKVLSKQLKVDWINGAISFTGLNIHVMAAKGGPSLLGSIPAILIELGIQLLSFECWSDNTHVWCTMVVEGTHVDSLEQQILARVGGSKVHVEGERFRIF